jgi:DNA-binding transcriptional LysR family regulator
MELEPGMARMGLCQLRELVIPAEERHFGRAAAPEHMVQSALSQQLQWLERQPGILLLDRTNHHLAASPEVPVVKLAASGGSCRRGVVAS